MDRKKAFDIVLARIDEGKREEVIAKLREAETRAEKIEILKDYGVSLESPEDVLGDDWAEEGVDLTDDELEQVAGGEEMTWHTECNCEP